MQLNGSGTFQVTGGETRVQHKDMLTGLLINKTNARKPQDKYYSLEEKRK